MGIKRWISGMKSVLQTNSSRTPPQKGEISKKTVVGRLAAHAASTASTLQWTTEELLTANTNWILDLAAQRGLVTDAELVAATDTRNICLKRYLHTVVTPLGFPMNTRIHAIPGAVLPGRPGSIVSRKIYEQEAMGPPRARYISKASMPCAK
jgi:hypothetical protein